MQYYETETLMMVDHAKYCKSCQYQNYRGEEDPCNECLAYPERANSTVPMYYRKEADKKYSVSKDGLFPETRKR